MSTNRDAEVLPSDDAVPKIDASGLVAITRAEIDGQIATAKAYPRSLAGFIRESSELVSLDADTAEACIYALPRGKNDDGSKKFITGPSVRFAEIIQHAFGNNRSGGRVIAIDKEYIIAQGVFHDLEKNVQTVKEVQRRITDKNGRRFNADMIQVTGNAAISLAQRNAIIAGIPKAIWLPVYERARMVAVGDVTTLVDRRTLAVAWFARVGVSPEMICAKLGVAGVEDIGIEELEVLTGLKTAIRDGSRTPENAFEPDQEGSSARSAVNQDRNAAAEVLRNKGKGDPQALG